jgi:hypothetical protein
MTTRKEFHWFWAWEDEKEEAYLHAMALQGWHFQSVTFPGIYTFKKGIPQNDYYRLDFLTETKDREYYLQLFEDAGWRHVGAYGSWQYFCKTAGKDEIPEIFTDNESKQTKYRRILLFMIIFMPIYVVVFTRINEASSTFMKVITLVMFLFILLYAYAMVMLIRRVSQLRKKP